VAEGDPEKQLLQVTLEVTADQLDFLHRLSDFDGGSLEQTLVKVIEKARNSIQRNDIPVYLHRLIYSLLANHFPFNKMDEIIDDAIDMQNDLGKHDFLREHAKDIASRLMRR